MYKVFFNEKVIYIKTEAQNSEKCISIDEKSSIAPLIINFINDDQDLILCSEKPEEVLEWIKDEFEYHEAAGGIVKNEDDELLFIQRLGFWDLPKGHIEKGESPEDAAYREIREECGISSHILKEFIACTFHIYKMNGRMHIKKTHWFLFDMNDNSETFVPQVEEDIELVSWLGEDEIQLALLDSYQSIVELHQQYKANLA